MYKILFIHGLASSGSYKMADMLRPAGVVAPDLPIDPDRALSALTDIYSTEKPDLVVGLSWGGFLALRLNAERTVVINPDLDISVLLRQHIGPMEYLSPRHNGERSFLITEEICRKYEALETSAINPDRAVLGCFGEQDTLVHCADKFESIFPGRAFRYPGGSVPSRPISRSGPTSLFPISCLVRGIGVSLSSASGTDCWKCCRTEA